MTLTQASTAQNLEAGREAAIPYACGNPEHPYNPAYWVSGSQTVRVEALDSAHIVPDKQSAVPGDTVTFYGVGFGATVNSIPAGMIAPLGSALLDTLTWQFGSTAATVLFSGLAPGAVGLYQFNVLIPDIPAGEYPITVRVGGQAVPQVLNLQTSR